jgi:hypothetical protein
MTLKNAKIMSIFHRMECQALFAFSRILMEFIFWTLLAPFGSDGMKNRV